MKAERAPPHHLAPRRLGAFFLCGGGPRLRARGAALQPCLLSSGLAFGSTSSRQKRQPSPRAPPRTLRPRADVRVVTIRPQDRSRSPVALPWRLAPANCPSLTRTRSACRDGLLPAPDAPAPPGVPLSSAASPVPSGRSPPPSIERPPRSGPIGGRPRNLLLSCRHLARFLTATFSAPGLFATRACPRRRPLPSRFVDPLCTFAQRRRPSAAGSLAVRVDPSPVEGLSVH